MVSGITGLKADVNANQWNGAIGLFRRLDMYENVGDARVALLNRALNLVRNVVALVDGNVAVHADVQIDVILQTHFTGMAFLHVDNTGN